jgi:mannosylglycoprotein endo-beta-mannosidase
MELPSTYFDRNPAQPYHNFNIGFQPEIGSVSVPTRNGMLKIMTKKEIELGYPPRNASSFVGETWNFHNFQEWTTLLPNNDSYDHVYAYFGHERTVDSDDWIAAAQLASHAQYRNLFNGYISRLFNYTSAVIMWKTQTPWPSLRGFLYDWYLESTGALIGVRSALRSPISIVFDAQSWQLLIVNRQVLPISIFTRPKIGVDFTWIDIHGSTISSGEMLLYSDIVPAMSAMLLGVDHDRLQWPRRCTDVCFLHLQGKGGRGVDIRSSWYWLTDPELGDAGNYSQLGEMRSRQISAFELNVEKCLILEGRLVVVLMIRVHSESPDVLFYPTFSIFKNIDGSQLLPLLDSGDDHVIIMQGTSQRFMLETSSNDKAGEDFMIKLNSWNAKEVVHNVTCRRK